MLVHLRLFEALSEVCGVEMVWAGWPRKGKAASCSCTCGCLRPSQRCVVWGWCGVVWGGPGRGGRPHAHAPAAV